MSSLLILLLALAPVRAEIPGSIKAFGLEELNETAPDLRARDGLGRQQDLAQHRGHFVLLHLWASWCAPCRKELPELQKFAEVYKDAGLELLTISVDKDGDRPKVETELKELGLTGPALMLEKDSESARYTAWGVPMTYLVDPEGKLMGRGRGSVEWAKIVSEQFRGFLTEHTPKIKK